MPKLLDMILRRLGLTRSIRPARRRSYRPQPIDTYYICRPVLHHTQQHLLAAGCQGKETIAFWAGYQTGDGRATICTAVCPQTHESYGHALVSRDVVQSMLRKLRSSDLVVLAQVHSHPTTTAPSPTDIECALDFTQGFLSIIVPDFAARGFSDISECNVLEYQSKSSSWRSLNAEEKRHRFRVDEELMDVRGKQVAGG